MRFHDMMEEESAALLQYLFAHQQRPEFTRRFRWEVGSIAFWDNRCTQHNPINDYHGFRRVMHRVTLAATSRGENQPPELQSEVVSFVTIRCTCSRSAAETHSQVVLLLVAHLCFLHHPNPFLESKALSKYAVRIGQFYGWSASIRLHPGRPLRAAVGGTRGGGRVGAIPPRQSRAATKHGRVNGRAMVARGGERGHRGLAPQPRHAAIHGGVSRQRHRRRDFAGADRRRPRISALASSAPPQIARGDRRFAQRCRSGTRDGSPRRHGRAATAHGHVLRSCRLDCTIGAARSRRSAGPDRRLSSYRRRRRKAFRGLRREIYGRRDPDLFRLSSRAGRRCRAGSALRVGGRGHIGPEASPKSFEHA